jgi:hypothetical protein
LQQLAKKNAHYRQPLTALTISAEKITCIPVGTIQISGPKENPAVNGSSEVVPAPSTCQHKLVSPQSQLITKHHDFMIVDNHDLTAAHTMTIIWSKERRAAQRAPKSNVPDI